MLDLIVCDASFIGLAKVLARPLDFAAPQARLLALIKPQFEVGRDGIGKGGKPSLKVLPVPTWRAVDRAQGDRTTGPLMQRRDGTQMTRRSADRVLQRLARQAGIKKKISPHSLRRSVVTLALQAGVPVEVVQFDMDHASTRTTLHYNRLGVELHARASNTVAALLASAFDITKEVA